MSKTAVYNVRLDLKSIATIHHHYSSKGINLPSISALTRQIVELHSNMVVNQLKATPFQTLSEAYNYLKPLGLLKPLRNEAIIRGLQEESLQLEDISVDYLNRKSMKSISPDQVRKAKEILEQKTKEKTAGAILGPLPGTIKED